MSIDNDTGTKVPFEVRHRYTVPSAAVQVGATVTTSVVSLDDLHLKVFQKQFGDLTLTQIMQIVQSEVPYFANQDWDVHYRLPPEHPEMQRIAYENKRDLLAYAEVLLRIKGSGA